MTTLNADLSAYLSGERPAPSERDRGPDKGSQLGKVGNGTYRLIDTGIFGGDEIRSAIIFKPATVAPVGAYAILDTVSRSAVDGPRNRPALTQTFAQLSATAGASRLQ